MYKFKAVNERHGARDDSVGLGLRSAASPDLLIDEAAFNVETTNVKRLSRLHWEYILQSKVDSSLFIYMNADCDYVTKDVAIAQRKASREKLKQSPAKKNDNLAGANVILSGRKFICLRAYIKHARSHHDAINGFMSLADVQHEFKHGGGSSTLKCHLGRQR